MGKLLLLVVLLNIILLASCTGTKTTNPSTTQQETDTANCSNNNKNNNNTSTYTNDRGLIVNYNNDCPDALQRIIRAIITFTFQSLYELVTSKSESNTIVYSPLSIFYYMIYFILYTYDSTNKELLGFTNLKNGEEAICTMPIINAYTENMPKGIEYDYGLNVVSDYSDNFTEPFNEGLISYIGGFGLNFNFSDPLEVKYMVNSVIANQTNNRVQNAITSSSIYKKDSQYSKLVFANGEFFQGMWQKEFNTKNVTKGDYYDNQKPVTQVQYLRQCGVYNYTQNSKLGVQVVAIPYEQGYFDCVIMLPNKKCGLKSLAKSLQDPDTFQELMSSLKPAWIKLRLPVNYNASTEIDSVAILKKTGKIDSLFDPKEAQIENAYGKKTDEYVSDGRQRFVINSVSSGAEPYTDECSKNTDNLEEYEFIANRAVLFVISNNDVPQIAGYGKIIT